jgi:hypothetical protein
MAQRSFGKKGSCEHREYLRSDNGKLMGDLFFVKKLMKLRIKRLGTEKPPDKPPLT